MDLDELKVLVRNSVFNKNYYSVDISLKGCIRNNQPMIVAIASKRMYNYFIEWLNDDNI